jgi:uncharacterized protein
MKPQGKTKNSVNPYPGPGKQSPQRTCVACRQVKNKRDLVRLVRSVQGDIEIDATGKTDGRGAYLCPTKDCLGKALLGNQLEHTLKSRLAPDNRARLIKSGQELLKELSGKNR